MRAHPELREEASGNDHADKAASRVRESCFQPAAIPLSGVLAARTTAYISFIKHVHAIIVRVHDAAQRVRTAPAFALDPERQVFKVGDRLTQTSRGTC